MSHANLEARKQCCVKQGQYF